jgi:hypothetical protein
MLSNILFSAFPHGNNEEGAERSSPQERKGQEKPSAAINSREKPKAISETTLYSFFRI